MADKWRTWKVFEHNGKELFAYTLFGEGEDEEEATIALLAYKTIVARNLFMCIRK